MRLGDIIKPVKLLLHKEDNCRRIVPLISGFCERDNKKIGHHMVHLRSICGVILTRKTLVYGPLKIPLLLAKKRSMIKNSVYVARRFGYAS